MATDETAGFAALLREPIADTELAQAFDDPALLASQICGTPMAIIGLLDEERPWLTSRLGTSGTEAAHWMAFCAQKTRQDNVVVVPDTLADERFRQNPLVGGTPGIRFFAGAWVARDGRQRGGLCVLDRVPRTLTPGQQAALSGLGHQAAAQLELRLNLDQLKEALRERDQADEAQRRLVQEPRASFEGASRLTALLSLCSAFQFSFEIHAGPTGIGAVTDGVAQALQNKPGVAGHEFEIELAIHEALANAIRHGCHSDPTKLVQCSVSYEATGDVIVMRDPGPGFVAADVPNPLEGSNLLRDHPPAPIICETTFLGRLV